MPTYGITAFSVPRRPSEPERSWLVRNACMADVMPEPMHEHLARLGLEQDLAVSDIGVPVPLESEWAGSVTRPPMTAYCPLCFQRDLRRRELPHFRRQWQDPFSTHCHVDRTPLFRWPHRYDGGRHVFFPRWLLELHESHSPLRPIGEKRGHPLNQDVILQLRLAREVRRRMTDGESGGLAWRQQLELEEALRQTTSSSLLMGARPDEVRRLVQELSVLFGSQFGSLRCQASHHAAFLGPQWLFASTFCDGGISPPNRRRSLMSFADPAQRRSLLALSVRLMMSFSTDGTFNDSLECESAGQTSISRDLEKLPLAGLRWLRLRLPRMPILFQRGAREWFERNRKITGCTVS